MTTKSALRLANKVAIITGASSGLGRAIALAYASHGTRMIVCADLHNKPLPGIANEEIPTHKLICDRYGSERAVFKKVGVGISMDVEACVAEAVRLGEGRLDIMVNNAGLGIGDKAKRIHETTEDSWDTMIKVNLRGNFLGCKFACAQFLRQELDTSGHRGWIINVASMLGLVGITNGAGAYCASKGAVVNLTRQIAVDYAKDRIHCNALCPGFTKTAMTKVNYEDEQISARMVATTPWGEWGNVDDVAGGAVFLANDDAAWVTGVPLPIDGGYLAQ